ncbi:hypothetical protein [Virgibacillus pantothenticus]|uniref:Uncharacterized protein n=1 Tax=Virgibacillus pantothenticus TaxID=1473 RepID=A0A0L0QWB6_VIRPA|nr:hypothetical protein [Virgibacillus pantothenticus]KNE22493.1 hypothetical protein AFK71_02430 [Virgibacillus pantothenticus]MED3737253.1 hypothetical protein [Virgibacillus pantothenticus]QTY16960.1 hypothetical protein KBP50_03295 [Virgibacillus pantothenticus]SIT11515.1 hypothetical protein SAMN05421787_11760 [Virgibacillus pantothenticus]
MLQAIKDRPEWAVKLSSSSFNLSAAVAKLISYREILEEKRKDDEFYLQIKNAFQENAEMDLRLAESFMDVSFEADQKVKGDEDEIE